MRQCILPFIALAIMAAACSNSSQKPESTKPEAPKRETPVRPAKTQAKKSAKDFNNATETYTGTAKGVKIVFRHIDYTQYRLKEGDKVTQGALNTEKGFEQDSDATVYILNSDKPVNKQKYFVRYTDGRFVKLNAQRKVVPDSKFSKK